MSEFTQYSVTFACSIRKMSIPVNRIAVPAGAVAPGNPPP